MSSTRRNHSHPATLGLHSCQVQGETTPIQPLYDFTLVNHKEKPLPSSDSRTSLLSSTRRNHSHPATLRLHSCQVQGETTPIQSLLDFTLVKHKEKPLPSRHYDFTLVSHKEKPLPSSHSRTSLLSSTRRNHSHPSTLGLHSCQTQGETTPIQTL